MKLYLYSTALKILLLSSRNNEDGLITAFSPSVHHYQYRMRLNSRGINNNNNNCRNSINSGKSSSHSNGRRGELRSGSSSWGTSRESRLSLFHSRSSLNSHNGDCPDELGTTSSIESESISSTALHENSLNGKDEVDRAPCFDGVCTSDPSLLDSTSSFSSSTTTTTGEAINRIGGVEDTNTPTVWSEFGRIAQDHPKASNLGQGFPDWTPPPFAVESLVEAALDTGAGPHQYTRTAGHPGLVRELAKRYGVHLGREVDAMNEVAVTVGASQALYLSLQTLLRPGDEVILFEPFFDLYVNQVKLAGGTPVFVPLTFVPYDDSPGVITGGEWKLDPSKLRDAISSEGKTRAIVLNSPHNPTGKVFSRSEMQHVADAVVEAGPQCVVLSDEVYKYIIHSPPKDENDTINGNEINGNAHNDSDNNNDARPAIKSPGHIHFASLPNMWDKTITISSAGKTFSATGWQVGWCLGPTHLISPIHRLLPHVQFCASTVIQEALARALPKADQPYEGYPSYYDHLRATYIRKRDLLVHALRTAGFAVPDYDKTPGGGFFVFARIGSDVKKSLPMERVNTPNPAAPGGVARLDWALCQWMAEEKGVICIPSGPFFSETRAREGASDEFVRIAFCKTDDTIAAAAQALLNLNNAGVQHDHIGNGDVADVVFEDDVDLKDLRNVGHNDDDDDDFNDVTGAGEMVNSVDGSKLTEGEEVQLR